MGLNPKTLNRADFVAVVETAEASQLRKSAQPHTASGDVPTLASLVPSDSPPTFHRKGFPAVVDIAGQLAAALAAAGAKLQWFQDRSSLYQTKFLCEKEASRSTGRASPQSSR